MTTHTQPKPAGTPTWVDLTTPDLDGARSFYHTVFGWEYDIGAPEYGGYTNARAEGRIAAGLGGPMPGSPPVPATWSLYFATDDIEADVARAVELGAKVHVPAMSVAPFGSMAVLEDPTGAPFGFWQAGEHIGSEVNDKHGAAAWYELYSPNAQQARDFYCALLGATAEPMPGGPEYYVFKRGEQMLCAVMQTDPAWGASPTSRAPRASARSSRPSARFTMAKWPGPLTISGCPRSVPSRSLKWPARPWCAMCRLTVRESEPLVMMRV